MPLCGTASQSSALQREGSSIIFPEIEDEEYPFCYPLSKPEAHHRGKAMQRHKESCAVTSTNQCVSCPSCNSLHHYCNDKWPKKTAFLKLLLFFLPFHFLLKSLISRLIGKVNLQGGGEANQSSRRCFIAAQTTNHFDTKLFFRWGFSCRLLHCAVYTTKANFSLQFTITINADLPIFFSQQYLASFLIALMKRIHQ